MQEQNGKNEEKKSITCKQWTLLSLLFSQGFISECLLSLMFPIYPNQASKVGMSTAVIGLLFGFYSFVLFLTSPVLGKLIPRLGTKSMYIGGAIINGCSSLLFGILEVTQDYTTFTTASFLLRGFEALGASASITATYAIIADVFPEHNGFARGMLEVSFGVGMCIGPGMGSFLYTFGGFGLPLYVIGAMTLLTVPPSIFILPQSHEYNDNAGASMYSALLQVPRVIGEIINLLVIGICWSSLQPSIEPYLREHNIEPMQIGVVFVFGSLLYAGSCPLWGYLTDRMEYHWMIPTGAFGMAVCFFILGVIPIFFEDCIWRDIIGMSLQDAFMTMALVPSYQALFDNARRNGFENNTATHGIVTGLWISVFFLSEVIGPIMGGYLTETIGFHNTNIVFTVLLLMSSVMSLFTALPLPVKEEAEDKYIGK